MTTMAYIGLPVLIFVILCRTANAQPVEVKSGDANFTTFCGHDEMAVLVEVEAGFQGKIYTQGHEECWFMNEQSAADPLYARTFEYTSTGCGGKLRTTENKTREFSLTTIVQFSPDVLMSSDKAHESTCIFDEELTVGSRGYVNESGTNLDQSKSSAVGDRSADVDFGVYGSVGNDTVIVDDSTTVPVGFRLQLITVLKDNPIFSQMLVANCTASSRTNNTDPDYVSLRLLDETGCPASESLVEALQMVGPMYEDGAVGVDPASRSVLELSAFMFVKGRTGNSNQLAFTCDVLLCPDDNKDPCNFDCFSMEPYRKRRWVSLDPSVGSLEASQALSTRSEVRRRRAAAAEGTKLVTVGRTLQVFSLQKEEEESVTRPSPANSAQCLETPKMQSIMVAMGVLLLALLMVVVTLLVLICRRRRRHDDKGKRVNNGVSFGS